MKISEYFNKLDGMPIDELLDYLKSIGIETEKIDDNIEFNIFKEMNFKANENNPLSLRSLQDINESFILDDCYEVAA